MIIYVRCLLFFTIFISSCAGTEMNRWTIPLNSSPVNLQIDLPAELNSLKQSVHLSDCKPCGKHYTILADADFMNRVDDTTSFFAAWLSDTTTKSIFYIREPLYPQSFPVPPNYNLQEALNSMVDGLISEDARTIVRRKETGKDRALVYHEIPGRNGTIRSKRITCLTYIDGQLIEIHYIQYDKLGKESIDALWSSFQKMNLSGRQPDYLEDLPHD